MKTLFKIGEIIIKIGALIIIPSFLLFGCGEPSNKSPHVFTISDTAYHREESIIDSVNGYIQKLVNEDSIRAFEPLSFNRNSDVSYGLLNGQIVYWNHKGYIYFKGANSWLRYK